jgi:hypothetical protein
MNPTKQIIKQSKSKNNIKNLKNIDLRTIEKNY